MQSTGLAVHTAVGTLGNPKYRGITFRWARKDQCLAVLCYKCYFSIELRNKSARQNA
jgi:hypothetical protein